MDFDRREFGAIREPQLFNSVVQSGPFAIEANAVPTKDQAV